MKLHNNIYIEKLMLIGISESESISIYDKLIDYSRTTPQSFESVFSIVIDLFRMNKVLKIETGEIKQLSEVFNMNPNNSTTIKEPFMGFHNSKRKNLRNNKYLTK